MEKQKQAVTNSETYGIKGSGTATMTDVEKEIAKFACGTEAAHAVLLFTGTPLGERLGRAGGE